VNPFGNNSFGAIIQVSTPCRRNLVRDPLPCDERL